MRAKQIDALTSLRFVAAALIVIFHSKHNFGGFSFADHFSLTQAVSMFYVLSGFILSHTHKTITSGSDLTKFYVNRIARIWPLHLLTAISAIYIINSYGGPLPPTDIALNLTLSQSWIPKPETYFSLNGVSWSLSNEIFFYAVFPLLILNIEKTWRFKLLTTILLTILMLFAFKDSERQLMLWSAYISPLTRLSEFMLGIAAYQIYLKSQNLKKPKAFTSSCIEFIALFFVACAMWVGDLNFFSGLPLAVNKPVAIWFANCGGALAFAFLIVILAHQRGIISKSMQSRPLVYLGEISFSLYMVHQIVIRLFEMYPSATAGLSLPVTLTIYYSSAIAAAAFAHFLVEKPAQKLITWATGYSKKIEPSTNALNMKKARSD